MNDRFVVRAVVLFLGAVVLVGLGLGGYLSAVGRPVPDFVIGTTAAALGGLTGILVKTGTDPMQVVAPPGRPVEVDPVEGGQSVLAIFVAIVLAALVLKLFRVW